MISFTMQLAAKDMLVDLDLPFMSSQSGKLNFLYSPYSLNRLILILQFVLLEVCKTNSQYKVTM